MQHITTEHEARGLAEHILSPGRSTALCLISIPAGEQRPFIDASEVEASLGAGVEVVVIPTGPLTFTLEGQLGPGGGAYNGAGRIYPPESSGEGPTGPLVLCRNRAEGAAATKRLITAGLRYGVARLESEPAAQQVVKAEVRRLIPPTLAFVQTRDDDYLMVHSHRVRPSLLIEQLVEVGQQVSGVLAPDRELMISLPAVDITALQTYSEGSVVLGRVAEVQLDRALVELLPGITALILREDATGNEADRLSTLFSPGDVIPARVIRVGRPGGKPWKLRCIDVDDDEPVLSAPVLLPNGPPWLTPEMVTTLADPAHTTEEPDVEPDHADEPVAEPDAEPALDAEPTVEPEPESVLATAPGPRLPDGAKEIASPSSAPPEDAPHQLLLRVAELEKVVGKLQRGMVDLRRGYAELSRRGAGATGGSGPDVVAELVRQERDEARAQVLALTQSLAQAQAERNRARKEIRELRRELGSATKRLRRHVRGSDGPAFLNPEDDFRWQVRRTWIERIPAAEKAARPLGEYVVLPTFLDSLVETPGIDLGKVAEVVVDIATGRVHEISGYQTHQLRESDSGPPQVREDGATCWRVSVQAKTPSARRLHYWQPPGGRPPELSSVRLHDDMRP